MLPKVSGYEPAGSDRTPPRTGPMMTPILNVMGKIRNARDWYL